MAYPFAGDVVAIGGPGTGETLTPLDFGTVPAGSAKQILLEVNYTAQQTLVGAQIVIPAGSQGDFAVFAPQPPFPAQPAEAFPVIVEFRPKSPGAHAAELQLLGTVNSGIAVLTRVPLAGSS